MITYGNRFFTMNIALTIVSLSFCCNAKNASMKDGGHPFSKVVIAYATYADVANYGCRFQYSPVDFCDKKHRAAIDHAINTKKPNFNSHFILLEISESDDGMHHSLVAIDTYTGDVYPLPFDSYSGLLDEHGNYKDSGRVIFDMNSPKICIDGSLVAYRATDIGEMCFTFDMDRFVGYRTAYTDCDPKGSQIRCTNPLKN